MHCKLAFIIVASLQMHFQLLYCICVSFAWPVSYLHNYIAVFMNCYKGIRSISCNQQCMHACSMMSPKLYLPYLPCMHMYSDWPNFPLYTRMHALHPRPSCSQGVIGASTEAVQQRRIVKVLIKSFRRTQLHSDRLLFFWYLHRATLKAWRYRRKIR